MAEKNVMQDSVNESSSDGLGILGWIIILALFMYFMSNSSGNNGIIKTEAYVENNANIVQTDWNVTNSARSISYSQTDLDNFLMLVLCEAGNQSTECMTAVASVVLNRVESNFGASISSVITAPNQFAVYNYGNFCVGGNPVTLNYFSKDQIDRARIAINSAFSGYDPTGPVGGALYFYGLDGLSAEEAACRSTISNKMQINDLYFYRVWD